MPLPLLALACPACGGELTVAQPVESGWCAECRRWLVWNPVLNVFTEEYMSESLSPWPALRAGLQQFATAFVASWEAWKTYLRGLFTPRYLPQRPPAAPQPRTLHLGLAVNARPAQPHLDRRPTRTPATRKR